MVYISDVKDLREFIKISKKKITKSTLKIMYFEFAFLIMKNPFFTITLEMLSGLMRILQLISIPLCDYFSKSWSDGPVFQIITTFINYFNLVPLLKGSDLMFIIFFYIGVLVVIALIVLAAVCMNYAMNQQQTDSIAFFIFKSLLIMCSSFLYVPFLRVFLGFFWKINGTFVFFTAYPSYSIIRVIHYIIGCIFSILLLVSSFLIQNVLFEIKYSKERKYAKTSSKIDIEVIFGQTVLTVVNILFTDEWLILFSSAIISFMILWDYILLKPYFSPFLSKMFMVYYTTFAWANGVLFVCKIIPNFNGGLMLFGLGILFIVLSCFYTHDESIVCLMKTINKCENAKVALKHVQYLIDIIQSKDSSRRSKILLDGYILIYEETCHLKDCPLAKYVNSTEDKKYKSLLFQHIETVYRIALKRYPSFIKLKISYANFLNDVLHKKIQSIEVLNQNMLFSYSLEDAFLLYRQKRDIEEDTYGPNSSNSNSNFGNNKLIAKNNASMLNLSYKNKLTDFKKEMTNASALYIEFWNLLMTEGSEAEKLLKLNNLGTKITKKVEEIELIFQKLQKMNAVDYEVLFYYSEFLKHVTNKGELADKYKSQYEKILQTTTDVDKEDTFLSIINTKDTNNSDEYQFVIVSSNPGSFGVIKNISLGLCILLGYTRDELIGKNINMIIPETLHNAHNQILQNKLNIFKHSDLNTTSDNSEMPTFKTIKTFAVNKSKYLIEISLLVGIFHSELYGSAFIARTCDDFGLETSQASSKTCYILTNHNFAIQTFTSTAVALLGLNTNVMNRGIDITKLIKQYYEEFFKEVMEHRGSNSTTTRQSILRSIAEKKYSSPSVVNFRNIENIEMLSEQKNGVERSGTLTGILNITNEANQSYSLTANKMKKLTNSNMLSSILNVNNNNNSSVSDFKGTKVNYDVIEGTFLLTVSKVIMAEQNRGFIFKFERNEAIASNVVGSNITSNIIDLSANKENDNIFEKILGSNNGNNKNGEYDYKTASMINFVIDPNKMSYVLNKKTIEESRDRLKQLALEKIKSLGEQSVEHKESELSSDEDESEEGSYTHSQDDDDDNNNNNDSGSNNSNEYLSNIPSDEEPLSNEDDDINIKHKTNKKRNDNNTNNNNNNNTNEHYKVNFSRIKFFMYDFRKKIVQSHPYEQRSQVDTAMYSSFKDKTTDDNDDDNSTSTNQNEQGEISRSKTYKSGSTTSKSTAHEIIEYTLSKKETQPALIKLKTFSFTTFIFILIFIVLWFYYINWMYSILQMNFKMIQLSYSAIMTSLYAISDVRQLTLLQNENFTGYVTSREIDYDYTVNDLRELYSKNHEVMKAITTSAIALQPQFKYVMNDEQVLISIYDVTKDVKNSYFMSLQSAIIEGNTALKHIITDLTQLTQFIPLETNIYFYLENSIKGIYTAETKQADAYEGEFVYKINTFQTYMILIVVMNVPVLGVFYFFIVCYFRRATKRKEEYLIIFFDIGINVIKCLLQNCEEFNNKIQCESILDFFNDEMALETELEDNVSQAINLNNANMNNVKNKKNHIQHTDVSASENIHLEILLALFFGSIIGINAMIYGLTNAYNNSMKDFTDVFKTQIKNNIEYLMLMINVREYCFGTMSYMGMNEDNDITKYLELFQQNVLQSQDSELEQKTFSSMFGEVIFGLYEGNVCETQKEYINILDGSTCEDVMYNSSKYGFTVLLSTYFTQIRFIKSHMDYLYLYGNEHHFVYNMTLTGTEYFFRNLPTSTQGVDEYFALHPIGVFNSEPFLNVVKAYRYIIRGCITGLFDTFVVEIIKYINNSQIVMNVVVGMFVVFVFACYFGVWIRYENKLNNSIYKTKNMITIIPVSILAGIPSIFKVLEINSMINSNIEKEGSTTITGSNVKAIASLVGTSDTSKKDGNSGNETVNVQQQQQETPTPGNGDS